MSEAFVVTADDARRIRETVIRSERDARNTVKPTRGTNELVEVHVVRITSTTQTENRYPGTLYSYNASSGSYTELSTVGGIWVDTPNGEALIVDRTYRAHAAGVRQSDGIPVFVVISVAPPFSGATVDYVGNDDVLSTYTVAWEKNTTCYDTDSYYAGGTPTRLTAPYTGVYIASAWAQFLCTPNHIANDWRTSLSIKPLGTPDAYGSGAIQVGRASGFKADGLCATGAVKLTAGQYLYVEAAGVIDGTGGTMQLILARFSMSLCEQANVPTIV